MKCICVAIIFCFLSAPILTRLLGKQKGSRLGGVARHEQAVALSFKTILEGTFQKQFEAAETRRNPWYGAFVKTDNQINLSLFHQISSNPKAKVVLGNDGTLIERAYLPAFNRQVVPKRGKLAALVNRIGKLGLLLREQGKQLVVLVSTNKPNFYPDLVPSWYRDGSRESKQAGSEMFFELLRARGVEPFDTGAFLRFVEHESNYPLFAATGTHWNEYAGCRVTSALLDRIGVELRLPMTQLHCSIAGERNRPVNQDLDLLEITNVWFPGALVKPAPIVAREIIRPKEAPAPRLLMVGTSFCWEILRNLDRARAFSEREFLYYFKRRFSFPGGAVRLIDKKTFDVDRAIENTDVVVLEVNEAFVHRAGYGFVERALEQLHTLKTGSK